MASILPMAATLKAELPPLLAEHQAIVAALDMLSAVAEEEQAPDYADLAVQLMRHAQTEEAVLYPASILVGEYLKLRLGR